MKLKQPFPNRHQEKEETDKTKQAQIDKGTKSTKIYQGTVSAIKFRKRLTKFKITIALPMKFGSKGFITTVKVTKIWRRSGESNKLRYVYPILGTPGDIAFRKGKLTISK